MSLMIESTTAKLRVRLIAHVAFKPSVSTKETQKLFSLAKRSPSLMARHFVVNEEKQTATCFENAPNTLP